MRLNEIVGEFLGLQYFEINTLYATTDPDSVEKVLKVLSLSIKFQTTVQMLILCIENGITSILSCSVIWEG